MTIPADSVWFITGCSTGFGRELAKLVLDRGWRVVATARGKDRVADIVELAPDRALAVDLDVADQAQIDAAVKAATERFGRIDVLVNNAGYGYQTSVEEGEDKEIRDQFEANVFGLFAMTRAVLPVMRAQKSGNIVNITSVGGLTGFASSGYYSATKHAVEGFSESLRAEVQPLGISVTCVEPGPFRTDWAGRSLHQTQSKIADYAETAQARMETTSGYSGQQPGDPVRAGEAMIEAVSRERPPRQLVLGKFAYETATALYRKRLEAIEADRELSLSADYPALAEA
ncbi:SDR family NAD(P)-dependent oxidoreductase [Sphingomonas panacisoli]|uniref:SDR family NAD(P)-dependent oxidoreductase n=1 Tax=Sphingomonas panacisoli TaxID=1813879 RepID=A0A5B8LIL7_9SPHN|nr:oxidoreductase [Sphingomonas panacisoli]QDZ08013.1 SDR family NAD(P)-dependent oxidoreductase [Sphingomonas panacisoli]